MKPNYDIRPNYTAFVMYRLFWATLILLLICTGATIALYSVVNPISIYAITGGVLLFFFFARKVRYNKTKLSFFDDKIVYETGGLISDSKTTLTIKNITHVRHKRPWIENNLFGTSTIGIECAGSGGTEAHIKSIPHGKEIYEYTQECMKSNGFKLAKEKLLQKEKPKKSAVIAKTLGITGLFIVFGGGPALLAVLAIAIAMPVILIPLIGVLLYVAISLVISIKDRIRRVYYVYDDCLEYTEGFLTKEDSIVPAENLADSNNNQNIFDRIFSVSNLIISTQGSGSITFSNMPNGEELENTIDSMARAYNPLVGKSSEENVEKAEKVAAKKARTRYTAKFTMHTPRAIATTLTFTILGIIVIAAIAITGLVSEEVLVAGITGGIYVLIFAGFMLINPLLKAMYTEYEVKKNGIYEKYELLRRTTHEFTDDKLVGIVVIRNPLDRFFNTATITFQSLSTSPNVTFKYIRNYESLLENLREKHYLDSPHVKTINADYKIRYAFAKNFLIMVPLFLGIAVLYYFVPIAAYTIIGLILARSLSGYIKFKNSKLDMFEEHLRHTVGYFFTKTVLARYEDIKNQASTSYRFTSVGGLYLGVGGGQPVNTENNAQSPAYGSMPNGFTADYLPETDKLLDRIDHIITGQGEGKTLLSARRSLKNPLLVHLALLPLLPTVLAVPITIWRVRKFRYELHETRIVEYHGVWNKVKRTVVYPNIDHVNVNRGVTNKMSGNGVIHIFTLGSSQEDLAIKNINEYEKWHDEIEKRYK